MLKNSIVIKSIGAAIILLIILILIYSFIKENFDSSNEDNHKVSFPYTLRKGEEPNSVLEPGYNEYLDEYNREDMNLLHPFNKDLHLDSVVYHKTPYTVPSSSVQSGGSIVWPYSFFDMKGGYMESDILKGLTPVNLAGQILNINSLVNKSQYANFTADGTLWWQTGTTSAIVNINDKNITLDSGGGNAFDFAGVIVGSGGMKIVGSNVPLYISGQQSNQYLGDTTLVKGLTVMRKRGGIALPSKNITMLQSDAIDELRWDEDNQLNSFANLTINSKKGVFNLNGHSQVLNNILMVDGAKLALGNNGNLKVNKFQVGGIIMPNAVWTIPNKNAPMFTGTGTITVGTVLPAAAPAPAVAKPGSSLSTSSVAVSIVKPSATVRVDNVAKKWPGTHSTRVHHDKMYRRDGALHSGDIVDITDNSGNYFQRGLLDSQILMGRPVAGSEMNTNLSKLRFLLLDHKADRQTPIHYGDKVYLLHNIYYNNKNVSRFIKYGHRLQSHQEGPLYRVFTIWNASDPKKRGPVHVNDVLHLARYTKSTTDSSKIYLHTTKNGSIATQATVHEATPFKIHVTRVYELHNANLATRPGEVLYP